MFFQQKFATFRKSKKLKKQSLSLFPYTSSVRIPGKKNTFLLSIVYFSLVFSSILKKSLWSRLYPPKIQLISLKLMAPCVSFHDSLNVLAHESLDTLKPARRLSLFDEFWVTSQQNLPNIVREFLSSQILLGLAYVVWFVPQNPSPLPPTPTCCRRLPWAINEVLQELASSHNADGYTSENQPLLPCGKSAGAWRSRRAHHRSQRPSTIQFGSCSQGCAIGN